MLNQRARQMNELLFSFLRKTEFCNEHFGDCVSDVMRPRSDTGEQLLVRVQERNILNSDSSRKRELALHFDELGKWNIDV